MELNRAIDTAGTPKEGMAETTLREFMGSDAPLVALVLLVGIAGSGVARWGLGQLGLDVLGQIIFVMGYTGMVFVLWYGWIRPLDITGPD